MARIRLSGSSIKFQNRNKFSTILIAFWSATGIKCDFGARRVVEVVVAVVAVVVVAVVVLWLVTFFYI